MSQTTQPKRHRATQPPSQRKAASTGNRLVAGTRRVSSPSAQAGNGAVSLQSAIAALDDTMRRALMASGRKDAADFARLPREEQNAFLAQARGLEKNPSRDGVRDYDPETIERSPLNRDEFAEEEMEGLLTSVKKYGVLQNGILRPSKNPRGKIKWELIAGERRWLCAIKAKKPFPAALRDVDDLEALEIQAIENLKREQLNAIHEATKYQQLLTAYEGQGLSKTGAIARLEETVGRENVSRSTIYARLALLNLPLATRKAVLQRKLPPSHASLLTELKNPQNIETLTKQILNPKEDKDHDPDAKGVMSFKAAAQLVKQAVRGEKYDAVWEKMAEKFRAAGLVVLTPAECAAATSHDSDDPDRYLSVGGNYVSENETCDLAGADWRSFKKLWKKPPPQVLSRTPNGMPVVIYEKTAAEAAVRTSGKLRKPGCGKSGNSGTSEAERERNRSHKRRLKDFAAAMEGILRSLKKTAASHGHELPRLMALLLVKQWRCEPLRRTIARRAWSKEGRFEQTIEKNMGGMEIEDLVGLMIEILLWHEAPSAYGEKWGEMLPQFCHLSGVPLPTWKDGNVQTSGR